MSLPVIYIDVVTFSVFLLVALVIGIAGGWLVAQRRRSHVVDEKPSESRLFLQLMSRADHALDNYITSIQGHLSVLGEELPTDLQRWQTSRNAIAEATAQMKRHVQRLRLIRMGLDETTLRVAPVNLARLIEHILITLEPGATQKDVTLRMEVKRLTEPVPGDPQVLEEIFTILLDNAIKHNPPGTEVVAELTRRNGMALARISDTGKGMDQELMSHIFDAGERDAGAGTPRGTGMGLYIAKMLTELHGGTIEVESQPQQGSVFSVALPLTQTGN